MIFNSFDILLKLIRNTRHSRILYLLEICITCLLLTNCNPIYYSPNSLNVPLLTTAGETNATVAGNADQVEFQMAHAFSEKFAVLADGGLFIPKDLETGEGGSGAGGEGIEEDEVVVVPRANPTLWTPTFLSRVRTLCRTDGPGAVLATYSAATPTRVSLLLAGFHVGAGCSTGSKQETTVAATVPEALEAPLSQRWLERWERSSARAPHGEALTSELEAQVRDHSQFSHLG